MPDTPIPEPMAGEAADALIARFVEARARLELIASACVEPGMDHLPVVDGKESRRAFKADVFALLAALDARAAEIERLREFADIRDSQHLGTSSASRTIAARALGCQP